MYFVMHSSFTKYTSAQTTKTGQKVRREQVLRVEHCKCNIPAFLGNDRPNKHRQTNQSTDMRVNIPCLFKEIMTDRPTDRKKKQPTDGSDGSHREETLAMIISN